MASYTAKRMLLALPGLYKRTSLPAVDPTFMGATDACPFRPYLCDTVNRVYTTDAGKDVTLKRAADDFAFSEDGEAVYGAALRVDGAATGEVVDLGRDVDADLGASYTLTFVIMPLWLTQPTAASSFYPFRGASGSNPRFGYDEQNGNIEAVNWRGRTSGSDQTLTYALGWKPKRLIAASLVVDNVAGTTKLYVNGVERVSLSEAVKANITGTMRVHRAATQSGTTGKVNTEAYFTHAKALSASEVSTLHAMFTTGLTGESRVVRLMYALGLAAADLEAKVLDLRYMRQIDNATGGALTLLGKDVKVNRKAGETDASLRRRIKNRYLELFSDTAADSLIRLAAEVTNLTTQDIIFKPNADNVGADAHAAFTILLPPGTSAGTLADLDSMLSAAKAAGVKPYSGTKGSFEWDGAASTGWDSGAWEVVR